MNGDKIMSELVKTMRKAGIDPRVIYAIKKTGRIVTKQNMRLLSESDLAEWDAALSEYDSLHPIATKQSTPC